MKNNVVLKTCLPVATLIALVSCADISVRKIPTPTQYDTWDDKKQEAADSIGGFRYYLPRQFVSVKKEFLLPNSGTSQLVRGQLSIDGRLVSLETSTLPPEWKSVIASTPVELQEVFIAPTSPLLVPGAQGNPGGVPNAQGTVTAAPTPWELAGAVAVSNLAPAHLGRSGDPVAFTLTVTKAVLGTDDCKLTSVRGLYLVPVAGGKVGTLEEARELPMSLYVEGADSGTLTLKGFLLEMPRGGYVFAVRCAKKVAGATQEFFAYPPPTANQLSVGADWVKDSDPQVGAENLAQTAGPVRVKGITVSRPNNVRGKAEKLDLAMTVKAEELKTGADQRQLDGIAAGAAPIGAITGVGLVPDSGGQPKPENAVRLPFTGGTTKSTAAAVDFVGVINYERPNSKKLEADTNYYAAAWVTTADGTGKPVTTLVISENTVLNVGSYVFKLPDLPQPVAGSGGGSGTPTPGTGSGYGSGSGSGSGTQNRPAAGGGSSAQGGSMEITTQQEVPAGRLAVNLRGNPTNGPVTEINEFFDVVIMQDFDEQYAVRPIARLSDASIEIALKQGWLLENGTAHIDNKAIAQFLFNQIGKTLDLARDLVRVDQGLLARVVSPTTSAAAGAATAMAGSIPAAQGTGGGASLRPAVFRLVKRNYAVPKLYPILKPREIRAANPADWKVKLANESWIKIEAREELIVELISFGEPPAPKPIDNAGHISKADLIKKAQEFANNSAQFKDIEVVDASINVTADQVFVVKKDGSEVTPADRTAFAVALNEKAAGWNAKKITVEKGVKRP